ncbi:MAG: hypothetical protein WBQ26_07440 [Gemmatimonadaceae bacterium]|nr:hypothetical protein [Gemmatimonadaceae bacterium]
MNEHLRDRILRRLDTLSDERGYQALDYIEFLESKYAERQSPAANAFTRLTESVEDTLRAGRVSASVIAETMAFLNRASGVLNSALAAGKSVADDVVKVAKQATTQPGIVPVIGAPTSTAPTGTATTSAAPTRPAPARPAPARPAQDR